MLVTLAEALLRRPSRLRPKTRLEGMLEEKMYA